MNDSFVSRHLVVIGSGVVIGALLAHVVIAPRHDDAPSAPRTAPCASALVPPVESVTPADEQRLIRDADLRGQRVLASQRASRSRSAVRFLARTPRAPVSLRQASKPLSASKSGGDFYRLRVCESGNNYSINTGNGFYGAYQFDLQTWRGLGYSGMPHLASPTTQDSAARKLQAQRGWQPWPGCRRKLGLS